MGKEMNGLQHSDIEKAKQFGFLVLIGAALTLASVYSDVDLGQVHSGFKFVTELLGTIISGSEDMITTGVNATRGNLHLTANFADIAVHASNDGTFNALSRGVRPNMISQFFAQAANYLP